MTYGNKVSFLKWCSSTTQFLSPRSLNNFITRICFGQSPISFGLTTHLILIFGPLGYYPFRTKRPRRSFIRREELFFATTSRSRKADPNRHTLQSGLCRCRWSNSAPFDPTHIPFGCPPFRLCTLDHCMQDPSRPVSEDLRSQYKESSKGNNRFGQGPTTRITNIVFRFKGLWNKIITTV